MPRADTKPFHGSQVNHSPYPPHYLSESNAHSSSSSTSSASSNNGPLQRPSVSRSSSPSKKKHVCSTCDRAFTTSGHLARHSRVHTGERNHKCPFPGCETRCSRQDNLQQHYRIHLSPGSRRSSRSSNRAKGSAPARRKRSPSSGPESTVATSSPATPAPVETSKPRPPSLSPPLIPTRSYKHALTPPDSPPPLAQATLPATAQLHDSPSRSASSGPPQASYSTLHLTLGTVSDETHLDSEDQFSYRSTTIYHDQNHLHFDYLPPASVCQTPVNNLSSNYSAYPSPQDYQQRLSHLSETSLHEIHSRDASPVSLPTGRHLSNASYSGTSTMNPPSPISSHSVSSLTSTPPTPTYPIYDNVQLYQANQVYQMQPSRFESPPPTLAPIQDRFLRRNVPSLQPTAYIHHPQPLTTDYSYQTSLSLGHGHIWKTEDVIQKGFGTLVQ